MQNVTKGGDYSTDIQNICQGITKRNWYFVSGPFYDLFSADLANMVLNTIPGASKQSELPFDEIAQSVNYNCKYDFSWKRPLFANRYDVFIPNIASLSIARDISTAENIADEIERRLADALACDKISKNIKMYFDEKKVRIEQ